MKMTFGLVVYNEEQKIQRCLDSIRDIADEIIVVHDGPCIDKTIEIAKNYTSKIFIRDRLKGSDPHRLFILREAENDWIFMIDVDEFLSADLAGFLKCKNLDDESSAYDF